MGLRSHFCALSVNKLPPVAYTERMSDMVISDKESAFRFIAYIAGALSGKAGGEISFSGGRVYLHVRAQGELPACLLAALEDRIAEVYCIGYKYAYLRENIGAAGLREEERGILLSAVIAADLAADKRYVRARLKEVREHTLDGFFRFRLRDLEEKWRSVAVGIPRVFTDGQLADFMAYLLGISKGKVFLKGHSVYDTRCRKLHRSFLLDAAGGGDAVREIVLSGAGRIECLGTPGEREENFLKRYYAGRVAFFA